MAEYVVEFGKDGRPVEPDGRLDAAAFHRNHAADLGGAAAIPRRQIRRRGRGRQRHRPACRAFCQALPRHHLVAERSQRAASEEHRGVARACGLPNIRPPLRIDLTDPAWCPAMHDGSGPAELLAVFCANVIHIAPWRVAEGLFAGAARYLRATGGCFSTARSSATASTPR